MLLEIYVVNDLDGEEKALMPADNMKSKLKKES
jgi:hypothetical protein